MQNYSCKTCGAELFWDTAAGCLKCQYCDSMFQPSDFNDNTLTNEPVQSEEVDKQYTTVSDVGDDMSVYECKTCGGEVVTLKTTMATVCPYCGEAISITSRSAGNFRPEICIPFKKDKKEIIEIYKNYVNKSFLTPKIFKEENTIEKIQGLFTPFYLHTMQDSARHQFEGEKTSSRRVGDDKVTTHNVYSLKLDAVGHFKRIPTDASVRVDDQLMEAVEPFDYSECKDYNPAYMAGFCAEQADDNKADLDNRAETRATQAMKEKARSAFSGYSSIKSLSETNNITQHVSEYVMMPVWLLNVKHDDKKYTFAINGQTGKVTGKLPIDKLKLFLLGGGAFVLTDLIVALINVFG